MSEIIQTYRRLTKDDLVEALKSWDAFLGKKIHLVACGGTAMTLLGAKESTKDVDFMVPVGSEYRYPIKTLADLGYKSVSGNGWQRQGEPFQFDLFEGNRIHTTELLESPLLDGRHYEFARMRRVWVGILNYYDLISSKLMRGTGVDFDDCLTLYGKRRAEIDLTRLREHFFELASYDVSEFRIGKNIDIFLEMVGAGESGDG